MIRRAVFVVVALATTAPALAQSRFEVSGGMTWTAGFDAGGSDALLSRGTPGTPLTLFSTSSRVEATPGVVARATCFLNNRLAVEGSAEYSRPVLRTTIANDFEQASGTEATDTLSSYVFGGSLLYRVGAGRVAPFISGGAGYLRQLDDEQLTLVTGSEIHGGGGVFVDVASHLRARLDAVASSRSKSLAFEARRRVLPIVSASLAYRF